MATIIRQSYIDKIERYLGKETIIVLVGQRRVGKSLYDQHRAHTALLRAHHRRKIGVENFSSVYLHGISLLFVWRMCPAM